MVYVLNRFKQPLMPCSNRKSRILLSQQKAKVFHKTHFTIQLLYGSSGYKQQVIAGLDTGSVTIGCAAIASSQVLYQSEVTIRNFQLKGKKSKTKLNARTTTQIQKIKSTPYFPELKYGASRSNFL
jgi:activator of 2-hydroxyglutaryl-CoA dehydratase